MFAFTPKADIAWHHTHVRSVPETDVAPTKADAIRPALASLCSAANWRDRGSAKLSRVPATEIERLILSAVRKHLAGNPHNKVEAEGPHSLNEKELISTHVARVDVKRDHLAIQLSAKSERDNEAQHRRHSAQQDESVHRDPHVLVVPWKRLRQNGCGRLFSPRRHPLIATLVQSAPRPALNSLPRSRRDGIGSTS